MSRYSLIVDAELDGPVDSLMGVSLEALPPAARRSRYNIGRDQDVVVFCSTSDSTDAPLVARTMRWGFIPHWIHSPNPALQPLTVPDKKISQPYFRDAFRERRCLMPASGFYAWQGWENGPAAPYYVRMRDRQPFFMAAIWDNCEGVDRVAMITTGANSLLRPIHDRMPAIIGDEQVDAWLHGDRPQQLLLPHVAAAMEIHQVGRRIFSLGNDGPELIEPLANSTPAALAQA